MAWFFEDERGEYAEAVHDSLVSRTAVVPHVWFLEVMNALLMGERRKRTTHAKVNNFIELSRYLSLVTDTQMSPQDILAIAREHNLSSYDAAYLELAIRRGLPLATLDRSLQAAAKTMGVERYNP